MKYIRNQKGIALVMVLVLAMIALAIVSALLFMLTKETILTASEKFYRTSEEATTGGSELVMQYLSGAGYLDIPSLGLGFNQNCRCGDPYDYTDNIDNLTGVKSDRCEKFCNPTSAWPAALDESIAPGLQVTLDPAADRLDGNPSADLNFTLGVAPQTFDIYAKIVDTVQGNSEMSALTSTGGRGDGVLVGMGTDHSDANQVSPPHNPYLYRVEVRAQATNNPRERSRISLLYAY